MENTSYMSEILNLIQTHPMEGLLVATIAVLGVGALFRLLPAAAGFTLGQAIRMSRGAVMSTYNNAHRFGASRQKMPQTAVEFDSYKPRKGDKWLWENSGITKEVLSITKDRNGVKQVNVLLNDGRESVTPYETFRTDRKSVV